MISKNNVHGKLYRKQFDYEPRKGYTNLDGKDIKTSKRNIANFDLNLLDSSPNEWGLLSEIAISNNGNLVAFTINYESSSEIYIRDLESIDPPFYLTSYSWGTDVHGIVDFTDDDEWVSFFDSGILKKVLFTNCTCAFKTMRTDPLITSF